jgi:hypothetical protein
MMPGASGWQSICADSARREVTRGFLEKRGFAFLPLRVSPLQQQRRGTISALQLFLFKQNGACGE